MKAPEKYRSIFGSFSHLSSSIPWTTGLSNMAEFLIWGTSYVLGVSKKEYTRQIIKWTKDDEMKDLSIDEISKKIDKKIDSLYKETEQFERYAKKSTGICTAREALRRVKYFSEDYLNKEFDIFLSLSSDQYLDEFYKQFINFDKKNSWSTHGNSGLYEYSTEISKMYMDNLAYNIDSNVLVANELKLNGKKNPDQILKYAFMHKELEKKKFITPNSNFLLLFIGGTEVQYDLKNEIKKEVEYCHQKGRFDLTTDEILKSAENICLKSITWMEIVIFNESYLNSLVNVHQVERKLIEGFNITLDEKSFMQIKT